MADNVTVEVQSGTTANIRTEDIGGGIQVPIVKLAFGGDGVATVVSSADPIPVIDSAGARETTLGTVVAALASLLTELGQKLEPGQSVELGAGTLAALETVTAGVANFPSDYPDAATLAKLELIRALLAGTLAVSGPLTDAQLAARALATDAKLEAVRALLAGTLACDKAAESLAGCTPWSRVSDASTNGVLVVSGAKKLKTIAISSVRTTFVVVRIFDKATAPTVGTDTPVMRFVVNPVTGAAAGGAASVCVPLPPEGLALANGIGISITTGVADSNTGAVGASEVLVNLAYR